MIDCGPAEDQPFHGVDGFGDMNYPTQPDLSIIKAENAIVAMHRLVTEVRRKMRMREINDIKQKTDFFVFLESLLFALALLRMWLWRLRHIQTLAVTLKKSTLWVETITVSISKYRIFITRENRLLRLCVE